jgi:two-component system OmpR family sensor kinase
VRIRLKLAILFTAATLVLLAGAGLLFLTSLRSGLQSSVDNSLRSRADEVIAQLGDSSDGLGRSGTALHLADNSYGQVLTTSGVVVQGTDGAGSAPLLSPRQAAAAASGTHHFDATLTLGRSALPTTGTTSSGTAPARTAPAGTTPAGTAPAGTTAGPLPARGEELRVLSAPTGQAGLVVAVAASQDVVDEALERAAKQLLLVGLLVLMVAGPGSWLLARGALRPVDRMRAQAAELEASDAGGGLTVPGTRDEISRLAQTFNGLLGRVHEAYRHERAFVADAGHELRTPLTVLRGELELAQRPGRTRAQLAETVEVAAAETERLIRLAEDLLVLAREDSEVPTRIERFDLAELLTAAVAAISSAAADRRISVVLDHCEVSEVWGSADRLRQAVDNVLVNALHFSPDGGVVSVRGGRMGSMVEVVVIDEGPGFPPDFLPVAFERFRRADPARNRQVGGSGLGLAIVAGIMRAHRGSATATNLPTGPGARVSLLWPSIPGPASEARASRPGGD